ncbi:MAG: hypothetical protein OXG60_03310 [Chloroflexi bacterium]|nr:hypothetical protein [Chloroflexota bacterium]
MLDGLPIRWLESYGWLVLSGSADPHSEIRALALSRCNASGAVAYISLADDFGDALMDDLAELGAPSGYLVDLEDEDNNEIHERLSGAGMIVIEGGDDIHRLKRLMTQTVVHAIKGALQDGALVLFEGLAATLAGSYYLDPSGEVASALKIVEDVYVAVDVNSFLETEPAQLVFQKRPDAVGVAIDRGSALVLGPDQHIETWGGKQITFSLGDPSRQADI